MKKLLLLLFLLFGLVVLYMNFHVNPYRDKAAQMIMVGFDGLTLTHENPIYRDIKDNHIGGVFYLIKKVGMRIRPEIFKILTNSVLS